MWWFLYRRLKTVYVLSLPFAFYGSAFLLIGLAPLGSSVASRGWIQNVATGFYALASSSGSIYFAVNFGDEGMLLSTGLKIEDSLLIHLRWCSCHILGLPCLYHSRHATNLRCGSVVLGLRTDQSLGAYFYRKQCCGCKPPRDHDSWCGNCLPNVGSGNRALDRPAKILSTSTRAYTFFLLLAFQEEDYSGISHPYGMTKLNSWLIQFLTVVLRRSNHSKLLAQRSLRPQLALPLVQPARRRMANCHPRRRLLHRRLGRFPLRLRRPIHPPLLGPPRLRNGSWSPAMGADVMGHK